MPDGTSRDVSVGMLTVVRLLQNPLGREAPPGEHGDMVRVSDGRARVYLLPSEFDSASPATLRWMLARQSSRTRGPATTGH
jgi:Ribosomal protein L9, N-terminal domain